MAAISQWCAAGVLAGSVISATMASAEDAKVRTFSNWSVTIQPASARQVLIPPSPTKNIRLVSQIEPAPAEPPSPAPAAAPEIVTKPGFPLIQPAGSPKVDALALARLYPQVYNAIPFNRPEYEANPSYRHDATMELLFGQMRPTVIQRGTTNVNHNYPAGDDYFYYPAPYSRYGFNSYFYPFRYGYGAGW